MIYVQNGLCQNLFKYADKAIILSYSFFNHLILSSLNISFIVTLSEAAVVRHVWLETVILFS